MNVGVFGPFVQEIKHGFVVMLVVGLVVAGNAMAENPGGLGVRVNAAVQSALQPSRSVVVVKAAKPVSAVLVVRVPVAAGRAVVAVESYFNKLGTLQADFSQRVTGEAFVSEGTFRLQRPKKFVWQYETPHRQRVISNGTAVYYMDQEGSQVTQLPVNGGLARVFNTSNLNLAKAGLKVQEAWETKERLVVVFGVDKNLKGDQAALKTLQMEFVKTPKGLQIAALETLDLLRMVTRIDLSNVKTGVAFARGAFDYTPGVYEQRN